jgi:glycosyltransferase involved in cell wall biosynthesis
MARGPLRYARALRTALSVRGPAPRRPRQPPGLRRPARPGQGLARPARRARDPVARARPDVHLALAGDGPDRAALERRVRELDLASRVTFLGYRSQAGVRDLLGQADVFVLASLAEGAPVVLMEAMAAGVPVVATRVAGIPELVEDGADGLLVPPGDAAALAAAVGRLIDDPALRASFARRGREKVERDFNVDREARRLCALLTGQPPPEDVRASPPASTPASP